jgi:xylitol oxidase
VALTNWAGNYTYRARAVHRPTTIEEVQELVAGAPRIRAIGTRHSFTGIGDSDELVTLDELPSVVVVDPGERTASFTVGVTYGELAGVLAEEGMALANLASLPHISVAGAVATATHGSGDANGNLATSVAAIELVRSDGELITVARGDEDFDGIVVGLGALGVVTRLALDVEPAYLVRQHVFEGLGWDVLFEHFDAITAAGYSVSAFTRWGETVDQVWVKSRVTGVGDALGDTLLGGALFGASAATAERHPIAGLDPVHCTPQLGAPGPWSERLPHFRLGFTPSSGAELQSEYLMPRRNAVAALEAVLALSDTIRPLTQVSEIRTIAADRLWISPAYGRDTVGIHFTWKPDQPSVERALALVEAALMPMGARPHWGKLFIADAAQIAPQYDRIGDFRALVERIDPRGAFRNDWLQTHVLGRS